MTLKAILLAIGISIVVLPGVERPADTPGARGGEAPVCDPGGPYPCQMVIRFDGRRSYDPDGTIVSYAWDFGDGQTSTESHVTHQYQSPGSYLVSLLVVDNDNLSSTCHITIDASEPCGGNCPPVCDPAGPYTGVAGEPVLFDGTGSLSPNTCIIVLYAWDFGDGATGTGPQPSHSYSLPGAYIITLTVTDYEGASSTCSTTAEITSPSAVDPTTWGRIKSHGRTDTR